MTFPAGAPGSDIPVVFRAAFTDWHARAGALSALPDAPVVPDGAERRGLVALGQAVGERVSTWAVRRDRTARRRQQPTAACVDGTSPAGWTTS
jgi:hypothetical protein